MITLDDGCAIAGRPAATVPKGAAGRLINGALFLTILISPLVFIEPSPYEGAMILLGLVCIAAKIEIDHRLLPLIWLLLLWNTGGLIAVLPVIDYPKTTQFAAVSLFLALSAIIYSALFTRDVIARLALLRRAYIIAAFIAAVIGIIGYFDIAGTAKYFAHMGRANSTFKDPNVFGPFLILPLMLMLQPLLRGQIRPRETFALLVILFGLFLSFSRGAWVHFAVSATVMIALLFFTAPDARSRGRLIVLVALTLAFLATLVVISLSFHTIGDMFEERARLLQRYDAGTNTGRFYLQFLALSDILAHPFGLGPYQFPLLHGGTQQHNVYLQAFLVYGWLGGLSYLVLTAITFGLGLRAAFTATPWQPFTIAVFATFVGLIVEGMVIDTDHWRHYFLLLGLIWGLSTANAHARLARRSGR